MTSVLSMPRATQIFVAISMAPVSPGFAGSGMISKIVLPREIDGKRIAGHESAGRTSRPRGKCCYNVVQHGSSQLRARGLIENCGETLLGRRQILDRNEDHG